MDDESKTEINKFYSDLLGKYGSSVESMAYQTPEQQKKRFAWLVDIGPLPRDSSVLDIGCGLGDLCRFLRGYGWKGRYTGVDINPDMIKAAKKGLPDDNFACKDILTEEFNEKHDYVFCVATIQHKPRYSNPYEYMEAMVKKCFSLTRKVFAFDVFSSRVDYMDDAKLYVDPARLLNFCYTLTGRVVLRNDSRPYEIMLYLFKDTAKDEFNIYRDWIPPEPRIV